MARKFLVSIDLNQNELQNAQIQNLGTAPSSPKTGQVYYDTGLNLMRTWNGSAWINASQGTTGAQGTQGVQGPQGLQGLQGVQGPQGTQGVQGTQGNQGTTGAQGTQGLQGVTGDTGAQGTQGVQGTTGAQGTTGLQGTQGTQGIQGNQGTTGSQGTTGTQGTQGLQGLQGIQGTQGPQGTDGIQGFTGLQGTAGSNATVTQGTGITVSGGVVSIDESYTATRAYVDNAVAGLDWHTAANLVATSSIPLTGSTNTVTIDGHATLTSTHSGYRLLLTAQSTDTEKGIYVYTDNGSTYTLTRPSDADAYDELVGAAIFIMEGTTYANTAWVQSNHYLSSFASQTWVQFSGASSYTAGAGLQATGNVFSVGQGTGITVNANDVAVDTSVVARKYAATVTGDSSSTDFVVTHSLNSSDPVVVVYEVTTNTEVITDILPSSTSQVTVRFAVAPATGKQYRVVIMA